MYLLYDRKLSLLLKPPSESSQANVPTMSRIRYNKIKSVVWYHIRQGPNQKKNRIKLFTYTLELLVGDEKKRWNESIEEKFRETGRRAGKSRHINQ